MSWEFVLQTELEAMQSHASSTVTDLACTFTVVYRVFLCNSLFLTALTDASGGSIDSTQRKCFVV